MFRTVNNALQDEDWQHYPVQCKEEALEEDQTEALDPFLGLKLLLIDGQLCHMPCL